MPLLTSYTSQDTFFHRLDPRTKFIWLAGLILLCLTTSQPILLSVLIIAILASSWAAKLDLRSFLPATRITCFLAVGLLLIQTIFLGEGDVIFRLGPVDFYVQGFWLALRATLRLYCIILVTLQFLMWTHPTDISLALVKAKMPYRYAMLIGLTLRFFPVMEEELGNILEAQEARGMELQGSLRKAFNLIPIAIPFCLRTLRRANEVALAMELRGYGFRPQRTFIRAIGYRSADYAITAAILVCVVAFFAVGANYLQPF